MPNAQHTHSDAQLDPRRWKALALFRSRALVGGNLVLLALGTSAFGVPFILTQYAHLLLGRSREPEAVTQAEPAIA